MAPANATRGKKRPVAKTHMLKEAAAQKASGKHATQGNIAAPISVASLVSVPMPVNADVQPTVPAPFRGMIIFHFLLLLSANSPDGGNCIISAAAQDTTPKEQDIEIVTLRGECYAYV